MARSCCQIVITQEVQYLAPQVSQRLHLQDCGGLL